MKILKICFWIAWRIWFYILIAVVIILLSPLLLATIWTDKTYPQFFVVARWWAKMVFFGMGFSYRAVWHQELEKGKSYVFIANHTSMMDIMLMLILVKENPFVFVGKQELAKLPIFGYFYKRTCILVDRNSSKSRLQVIKSAEERLDRGLSICIFPEGGVPDDTTLDLDRFKDGAFRLAVEYQIPIVPLTFGLLKHYFPFEFLAGKPARVPVVVHPFLSTQNKTSADKKELKERAHQLMLHQILEFERDFYSRFLG